MRQGHYGVGRSCCSGFEDADAVEFTGEVGDGFVEDGLAV